MPVMISQNFDVPGGVVNGCMGKLVSVRYKVGEDGNGEKERGSGRSNAATAPM
jgi:hypothetical protein